MKNLISLLIFLLFAWLAIWWYYSCDWCARDTAKNTVLIKEKERLEAEALAKKAYDDSITALKKASIGLFAKDQNDQNVFTYSENLQINNQNGDVFISESLQGFDKKVADFLGQHQDQEIIISGFETLQEQNINSGFGTSRANFIKDILINAGVNPDRIVTKVNPHNYNYSDDGTYDGGIDLLFNTLDQNRLEEVEKGIAGKTLYSEFAKETFQPDATLSNYTLELKNYLNKYPDKVVEIIGHTDDVGTEEANLWFGQQRANNVKEYFISQGIPKEKIKALSKGEANPIAPNDSEANKAKNRRIEITANQNKL